MNLYRVTVERQVTEVAEIDVREESAALAAAFVESALRDRSPILPVDWNRLKVVRLPKAVKSEEAA
jgi:hypothetical protein